MRSMLACDVGLAYPTIYAVPSNVKDNRGSSGGQKQSRLSFKHPSAQTWPPEVKACVRSRFRNGRLFWFDLSQIELRVAGVLSGEPSILLNYNLGRDLHTDRTLDLFGEPTLLTRYGPGWRKHPDFKDNERQWAKKFNFEDLYAAGPEKMQIIFIEETEKFLPLSFFRDVVASRRRLRPVLLAWQDSLLKRATRDGRLELPFFGQSRYFEGGAGSKDGGGTAIGEILNFPVQCTAANTLHRIYFAVCRALPSLSRHSRILPFLNVYDSLVIDAHPAEAPSVPAIIEAAVDYVRTRDYWSWLTDHYGYTCPLSYELKESA